MTNELIVKVANSLDLEPALLKAVQLVESNGEGFLSDGRPVILFEGHVMYKQFVKKYPDIDPSNLLKNYSSVFYQKWTKSKYVGGTGEYNRLELAKKIDAECALKSASWGMFQIMGFNHSLCNCQTVETFVDKVSESEESQLKLMYHYMANSGCLASLKAKDFEAFARKYNGSGQVEIYSQKLKNAYENFKNKI